MKIVIVKAWNGWPVGAEIDMADGIAETLITAGRAKKKPDSAEEPKIEKKKKGRKAND